MDVQVICSVDHKAMTKVRVAKEDAAQMGEGKRHVLDMTAVS